MGAMESLRWMEARLPEILKDLEAFVRRESPSGDLEGLEAAARFLEEAFGPLEGRLSRKDTPAGPVLLLKREGEGAPVLLLCHYDTVHPKGSCPEPFRLEREKAIGPGVYDMKGGIIALLYALRYAEATGRRLPALEVLFTPDEEVGRGVDFFDVKAFGADFAYTVDGGMEGELEYENFNAASAKVEIQGRNVHPGYAKNKMINAIDVACELQGLLPASQRPQFTEGYEGFYHCVGLNGTVENASVSYIIRDHDAEKFEQKKVFMWAAVDLLKKKYGDQVVTLTLKDQYYNMRKMVEPHPQVIDKALKAMEMAGVKPLVRPIRGGTDGARLSFMGLPCPNLFTGGMNFHGKFEYCSLTTMRKAQQVILNLAVLWSE